MRGEFALILKKTTYQLTTKMGSNLFIHVETTLHDLRDIGFPDLDKEQYPILFPTQASRV